MYCKFNLSNLIQKFSYCNNCFMDSSKKFGVTFSIIFIIISFILIYISENFYLISLSLILLSILFLLFSFFKPSYLDIPNKIWFRFGMLIASLTNPIILFLIYVLMIFPTNIFYFIFRYNPIYNKKKTRTFWISKKDYQSTLKDQF